MSRTTAAKTKRKRINFNIQAAPGSTVCVAGDFNQWNETKKKLTDKKGDGTFTGCLLLEPGTYEYKLVIDGQWHMDPQCEDTVENDQGTLNNVIRINQ